MAQSKVFIAFACLALVFLSYVKADEAQPSPASSSGPPAELTDEELSAVHKEVEKEISEKKITCENHEEICKKEDEESGIPPSEDKEKSVCRIILTNYLCKGPQTLDTIKDIAGKLMKLANDVERENASKPNEAPDAEKNNQ